MRLKKAIEATRLTRRRQKKAKYGDYGVAKKINKWKDSSKRVHLRKKLRVGTFANFPIVSTRLSLGNCSGIYR